MRIKISILIQRYLVDRIDGFDYLLHKESESHGGLPGPDRQQGGWRLWFLNRKQEKNRRKRQGAGPAGDRLGAFRRESGSRCRHSLGAEHPRPAGSPPPWGFVSFCFPLSVIHEQVRLNPAASDSLDPAPQRGRSGCGRTGLWVPGSRTDSKSQRPWEGAPRTPRKGRWGCQAPGLAGHACAGSGEGKTLHTPIPALPPPH